MPKEVQADCGIQIAASHTSKAMKFYPSPIGCGKYTSPEAAKKRQTENRHARAEILAGID